MAEDASPQSPPDYYALLSLYPRRHDPSLPPAEVKKAYKRALLQHHPDKKKQSSADVKSGISIDDLALAFKILSTPSLKASYDRSLRTQSKTETGGEIFHTGLDSVDLDDLAFDEAEEVWKRGCRCGDDGGFVVTESDLERNVEDGEFIVGCRGCSLWLRVEFGVEDG